jgi:hypothetical protein
MELNKDEIFIVQKGLDSIKYSLEGETDSASLGLLYWQNFKKENPNDKNVDYEIKGFKELVAQCKKRESQLNTLAKKIDNYYNGDDE